MLSKKFGKGGIAHVSLNKKGDIEVDARKAKKIPSPLNVELRRTKTEGRGKK